MRAPTWLRIALCASALMLVQPAAGLAGSLLYMDLVSTTPYTLGLKALSLRTLQVSTVLVIGPSESEFDQVSTADGGMYYATVQHPGPNGSLWAETIAVALPQAGSAADAVASPAKIVGRMNTSACYKLFVSAPAELLCVSAMNPVYRLDMKALTIRAVGTFSGSTVNQVAAYDAKAGLVYAWLEDGAGAQRLHAMNAKTGELLPPRVFQPNSIVDDISIDATGRAYGAVMNMTSGPPKAEWASFFASFDLTGGPSSAPIGFEPVGGAETFGVMSISRGSMTSCAIGTTPGAAKVCYPKINNGFLGGGTYFLTGFPDAVSPANDTIIGVDIKTGAVVLEAVRDGKRMLIDMAFTSS